MYFEAMGKFWNSCKKAIMTVAFLVKLSCVFVGIVEILSVVVAF